MGVDFSRESVLQQKMFSFCVRYCGNGIVLIDSIFEVLYFFMLFYVFGGAFFCTSIFCHPRFYCLKKKHKEGLGQRLAW